MTGSNGMLMALGIALAVGFAFAAGFVIGIFAARRLEDEEHLACLDEGKAAHRDNVTWP